MLLKTVPAQFVLFISVMDFLFLTRLIFFPSVLVHSGGVHGGHYYAFIRPTLSEQWYVY